jgi:hypothetical protein
MGTTFISIHGNGFWKHDGVLELWLRLLALHIEGPVDPQSVAHGIRTQWLLASRGYFTACVPANLEEFVSTTQRKEVVLDAIESLMLVLRAAPPTLDRGVLNILGMSGSLEADIETNRLLEVGDAFVALIEGRRGSDAYDREFVPAREANRVLPARRVPLQSAHGGLLEPWALHPNA